MPSNVMDERTERDLVPSPVHTSRGAHVSEVNWVVVV